MRPQDLAAAKTVAKIRVVSNTAGGKKSVARRSTGLDYSSSRVMTENWTPDVNSAEFAREGRRQSLLIASHPANEEEQAWLDEVSMWTDD